LTLTRTVLLLLPARRALSDTVTDAGQLREQFGEAATRK
jgi:hypothetical protein